MWYQAQEVYLVDAVAGAPKVPISIFSTKVGGGDDYSAV
jgi:hypothetical protein